MTTDAPAVTGLSVADHARAMELRGELVDTFYGDGAAGGRLVDGIGGLNSEKGHFCLLQNQQDKSVLRVRVIDAPGYFNRIAPKKRHPVFEYHGETGVMLMGENGQPLIKEYKILDEGGYQLWKQYVVSSGEGGDGNGVAPIASVSEPAIGQQGTQRKKRRRKRHRKQRVA